MCAYRPKETCQHKDTETYYWRGEIFTWLSYLLLYFRKVLRLIFVAGIIATKLHPLERK